ncbi:hypothetical protein V1477_000685 [Vespula maculifrons]|uniref:Uncharacterized protein n=1 Tax=Vespula maculifrons TaxID=7453 RepID=A0ABD2D2C1_VESMC
MTGQPCVKIPPIVGRNPDRTCSRRCLSKVAEETHSTVTPERFFAITEHGSSKEEQTWNAVRYLFLNEEGKQFETPATTSLLKSVENTKEVDANNIDNRLRDNMLYRNRELTMESPNLFGENPLSVCNHTSFYYYLV